jgi:hypothetical protein
MKLLALFSFMVIGLIYFGGLAGGIGEAVCINAQTGEGVNGLELFFYCNMNFFIFIIWLVALMAVMLL